MLGGKGNTLGKSSEVLAVGDVSRDVILMGFMYLAKVVEEKRVSSNFMFVMVNVFRMS